MRRALLLSMIIGLIGCNSYKRAPMVNYRDNDIREVLGSSGVYDYYDTTIHIHIILPEKRLMKKSYCSEEDRCFIYAGNKGIAVFHDDKGYANGFRTLPAISLEKSLSAFKDLDRLTIKKHKYHYSYAGHGLRVVMFNLEQKDFNSYVIVPLASLKIARRSNGQESGEMILEDIKGIL